MLLHGDTVVPRTPVLMQQKASLHLHGEQHGLHTAFLLTSPLNPGKHLSCPSFPSRQDQMQPTASGAQQEQRCGFCGAQEEPKGTVSHCGTVVFSGQGARFGSARAVWR